MKPDKIKAPEDIKPNCEIITSEDNPQWETRWYNSDNGWVYAFHRGYLWPQRHSSKYFRFRHLVQASAMKVWQEFMDYHDINKEKSSGH